MIVFFLCCALIANICKHLFLKLKNLKTNMSVMPFLSVTLLSSSNIRGTSKNNSCQGHILYVTSSIVIQQLYLIVCFITFITYQYLADINMVYHYSLELFLIGIHSMQGRTATTRHEVTRKRSTKRLKHTGKSL